MIAEVHVAPSPSGDSESQYKHIKAAIQVIQGSGLKYEVGALGTTIQGSDEDVWSVLRAVHEATMRSGAEKNFCNIRIYSASAEPLIEDLVSDYR